MADTVIIIPLIATGINLDAETLTVGLNTVLRERDQIAGRLADEIAEVKNADPASNLYALVTRNIPSGTQNTKLFGNDGLFAVNVNALNHLEIALHQWGGGSVTSAATLADNTANPIAPLVGSCLMVWDGATWDRVPGNATDGVRTNSVPTASATATPAGASVGVTQSQLLVANASRLSALITNTGTTSIFIGYNASVTATSGANQGGLLLPGGSWSPPGNIRPTMAIHAISDLAGGSVSVHEFTA